MNKAVGLAAGVVLFSLSVCILLGAWQTSNAPGVRRVWQHEENAGKDPSAEERQIPEDYLVDENFTTHLPLAVIDTDGEEIVNYKYYDEETDSMLYQEGVDPYIRMTLSIIDNPAGENHPGDVPALETQGKLKVRGNHSAMLSKLQYRIKLLDEEGLRAEHRILGMESSNDWVLSGTESDRSYLRTYLALNFTGSLQPCTPDVRFCELLMKKGDRYEYQGIYMFLEPVDRGVGRVDISKYDPQASHSAYILRRDRYDSTGVMLDTYLAYFPEKRAEWDLEWENDAVLGLIYPDKDVVTQETVEQVTEELDKFERILYSTDMSTFVQYRQYVDLDSFCDYFLMNEFLASYDAGLHSTYLYKEVGGKLTAGPVWDFDGAMDNVTGELTRYDYIVMGSRPWFEQMVKDPVFVNKLVSRFSWLREGLLSDENIERLTDEAAAYLGNAVYRDSQRWAEQYAAQLPPLQEKKTGLTVARNQGSYDHEVARLKDFLVLHARFMDKNLPLVRGDWGEEAAPFTALAILCFSGFFLAIVLVRRLHKL